MWEVAPPQGASSGRGACVWRLKAGGARPCQPERRGRPNPHANACSKREREPCEEKLGAYMALAITDMSRCRDCTKSEKSRQSSEMFFFVSLYIWCCALLISLSHYTHTKSQIKLKLKIAVERRGTSLRLEQIPAPRPARVSRAQSTRHTAIMIQAQPVRAGRSRTRQTSS